MKKKQVGLIVILSILIAFTALLGIRLYKGQQPDTPTGNLADIEWYDANQKEFTITTADELYDVVTLSYFYDFAGQTIKLGADIVVNEGNAKDWKEHEPERKWYPIQKFAGTFDGQGHTISGIYADTSDIYMALFTETNQKCVIQNFKLKNSYFETEGDLGTGSIVAYGGGTFKQIYSDAIIECDGGKVAGLFSNIVLDSTIEECWFDGEANSTRRFGGGIVDIVSGAKATIKHCLNTGTLNNSYIIQSCSFGGIVGCTINGGTLAVEDSLGVGKLNTVNKVRVGSVIGGSDSNTITTVLDSYGSADSAGVAISPVISNLNGGAIQVAEKNLKGVGGYQWTSLDFDKYWTTVTDGTPILQYYADEVQSVEGLKKCFDTSWYNKETAEFTLTTVEELFGVTYLSVSTTFEGKTIKLGADIKFNDGNAANWAKKAPETHWIPTRPFGGTLDGQGHTISGLYFDIASERAGLFSETTPTSVVKNLRITNSYMATTGGILGSVAGRGKGRVDTVYSDAIVTSSAGSVGGLVGQVAQDELVVTNCWFNGILSLTTNTGARGGGIVGFILNEETKASIDNCLFTGLIKTERDDGFSNVGGIYGLSTLGPIVTVKDCLSAGRFEVAYAGGVGTVIGHIGEGTATITNAYGVQSDYPGIMYIAKEAQVTGGAIALTEDRLIGVSGYQWTNLDFGKYWSALENKVPHLKSFSGKTLSVAGLKKLFSTDWYDVKKSTYTLSTPEDLYGFMLLSATTNFEGKTIKLGADIVMNTGNAADWANTAPANEWTPLQLFAGTFDGQGHTISGIYVNANKDKAGLFSETTPKATVKNLRLVNSYIKNDGNLVGSIAGRGNGKFDSIYSDAIITATGASNGGIVGQVNTGNTNSITNCWFNGSIELTEDKACQAGGIVGFVLLDGTSLLIDNCLSSGHISSVRTSAATNVGGICGSVDVNASVILKNSVHTGNFTVKNKVGVGTGIGRVGAGTTVAIQETYGIVGDFQGIGIKAGTPIGNVANYPKATLQGTEAYRMTGLDFDTYWMARMANTPILRTFGNANEAMSVAGIVRANTDWYDAKKNTYTISSEAEFLGFTKLSASENFEGKTIKLAKDITLNTGNASDWAESAPSNAWVPIQLFAGTFDGQGHTISGIYVNATTDKAGLFAETTQKATVQNLRLVNSYIKCDGNLVGSIAGRGNGTFASIYSDAIITATGASNGGIVGQVNAGSANSISNCWFNGSIELTEDKACQAGGIVGFVLLDGTSLSIDNCLSTAHISSVRTSAATNVGGICGTIDVNASVTLKNSVHTGNFTVKNKVGVGTAIGNIGKATVNIEETYGVAGEYKGIGLGSTVSGAVALYAEANLKGYEAYRMTGLDFEQFWAARKDKTPILKTFANEATLKITSDIARADVSWYDESKSEYELSTVDQFYGFAKLSQTNSFAGKTIKLIEDIPVNKLSNGETAKDLATKEAVNQWIPIGKSVVFEGTFDGQEHTISGIYVNETSDYAGLFGQTKGVIKNVSLKDSYIVGAGNMTGSIAGFATSNIENVYSNAVVESIAALDTTKEFECGGLIGRYGSTSEATISNCWFDGTVSSNNRGVGAIVGRIAMGTKTLKNCLATKTVTSTVTGTGVWAGGLIGAVVPQTTVDVIVQESLNVATVTAAHFVGVGSIIGLVSNDSNTTATIQNAYATNQTLSNNSAMAVVGIGSKTVTGGVLLNKTNIAGDGAFQMTGLDFTTYWTAKTGVTPELKAFTSDSGSLTAPATQVYVGWYNGTDGENIITTTAGLYGFAQLVSNVSANNYFLNTTVKLGADIYVNEGTLDPKGNRTDWEAEVADWNVWTPISVFGGTFDGQGHTISGIYVNKAGDLSGLFTETSFKSTVKNLRLENSYIKGNGNFVGSIAGRGNGTFDTIYTNAIVESTGSNTAGLMGQINAATSISNFQFNGTVIGAKNGGDRIGGIAGFVNDCTVSVDNCLIAGKVSCGKVAGDANMGGLFGSVLNTATMTIQSSLVLDQVVEPKNFAKVGTIVGNAANTITCNYVYAKKDSTTVGTGTVLGTILFFDSNDAIKGNGAFQMKGLDFDNTWAVKQGKTPELRSFVSKDGILPTPATQVYTGWYDGKTGAYTLTTAAGLRGLSELSDTKNFAGSVIKLGADIVLNEGELDPKGKETDWNDVIADWNTITPIGTGTWFNGTFDGQGHTIRGLYVSDNKGSTENSHVGLFAKVNTLAKIQNFKLEDSYIQGGGYYVGSIVGQSNGAQYTNVYSDAIVKGNTAMVGGLVGAVQSGGGTFTNCWYDGVMKLTSSSCQAGGLIGAVRNDLCTVTIDNCLNSADIYSARTDGDHWIGGLVGTLRIGTPTLTITNSLCVGTVTIEANPKGVGALVGHVDVGTLNMNHTVYGVEGSHATLGSSKTGTTVTDNANLIAKENLLGENARKYAKELEYDSVWNTTIDGTPVLAVFAEEVVVVADTSWYNTNDTEFTLTTAAELFGLAELSQTKNFAGVTIKLGADITTNIGAASGWASSAPANIWTPIGNASVAFAGNFDGQNHTIRGLYVKDTAETGYVGMFANLSGNAQNFSLANCYFASNGNMIGSVAGFLTGNLEGIKSKAIVVNTATTGLIQDSVAERGRECGGLVGRFGSGYDRSISNCWFAGTVTSNKRDLGGIVGRVAMGNKNIAHCLNTGTVTTKMLSGTWAGGMVGSVDAQGTASVSLTLTDCLNTGNVKTEGYWVTGAVIGQITKGNTVTIEKTYATNECYTAPNGQPRAIGNVGDGVATVGNVTLKEQSLLTGEAAQSNAPSLDWTTYWATVDGQLPILKKFKEE